MKNLSSISIIILLMLSISCSQKASVKSPLEGQATYPALDHGVIKINDYIDQNTYNQYGVATFAGGCFWCTEAAFERIEGVVDVISGYSAGQDPSPTYKKIGTGTTGHAEAIQIYYDKTKIDYKTLLDVFFIAHDPTTLNRQGPDRGTQYRSGIYYRTDDEKIAIDAAIAKWNEKGVYKNPIITEVDKYTEFWVAEGYHQNFYELNPSQSYVSNVSRPKVEKVLSKYPELIKEKFKTKQ